MVGSLRRPWLAVACALVGVGVVVALLLRHFLLSPEHTADAIGGSWFIEHERALAGAAHGRLVRRSHGKARLVAGLAGEVRYLGDDCVLFSTQEAVYGRRVFGACGDRQSVFLAAGSPQEWAMQRVSLQHFDWSSGRGELVGELTFEAVKHAALNGKEP